MVTLIEPSVLIKTFFTKTKCEVNKVKKSNFIIEMAVENGYLVYNTLSKELLFLTNDEYLCYMKCEFASSNKLFDYLLEHLFLVADEKDEFKFLNEIKQFIMLFEKNDTKLFTILTTLDCNARCFYCYEQRLSNSNMSLNTADKISRYIIDNCKDKKVRFNWFGGEPLYNSTIIDLICEQLQNNNIDFESEMISNAYLFDENTIYKSVEKWKLKKVQVTIDGTENVYNKTKNYIYKNNTSPFRTVINNIENLLKANIFVNIRLNLTNRNFYDLNNLIEYLKMKFAKYININVYIGIVADYKNLENIWGTDERKETLDKYFILENKLFESGLKRVKKLSNLIGIGKCMAQSKNAIVIAPNGDFCRCEHYSSDIAYYNIHTEEYREELYKEWDVMLQKNDNCKNCNYLPMCDINLKCPSFKSFKCNIDEKKAMIYPLKVAIKTYYNYWLRNQL